MVNLENIPSKLSADVIVVGGGPAGFCAAVAVIAVKTQTVVRKIDVQNLRKTLKENGVYL